jgi:hypothetical protein
VFTRAGGVWSQQGPKLTGAGEEGAAWFGYTVALSGDGKTALIGGWLDHAGHEFGWQGAAWVLTRSGSSWNQQKLTGSEEIGEGMFGTNVTLSADGNTALIGGWNDDSVFAGNRDYSGKGAAWVFIRTGGVWSQQGPKLTATGEIGDAPDNENGKFGTIVALSADGSTALIGGWNDNVSKGAAWVFTRTGGVWSQQGPKLTPTGEVGEGRFGVAVALSADGNTALIGALYDSGASGAAWEFTRSGSTWAQQGGKLTGGGASGESEFGTNVALSADGATALIGGWRDNGGTGASWVFVDPPTATTGAATSVGETSAGLNGDLGAGGSSTAYFEYGTSTAYGSSTAAQSVGFSTGSRPLAATVSGLEPGTTYHFRVVVENSGGVAYGADQTFASKTQGGGTTPPTEPTPPKPPPPPVVQNARQSKTRWREGHRLARISRGKAPIGTTFSFSLNEEATVTLGFTRRVNRRAATAGTLTFTGHTGTNRVAFQGRISPGKKLKPGRYTLVITAANSAGVSSAPKSLSFTIVK